MKREMSRQEFLKVGGAAGAFVAFPSLAQAQEPPESKGTREILVPDMGDRTYWELLMFCCLQGLANRAEARVFLYYPEKSEESWYSEYSVPDERVFYDWYRQYDYLKFNSLDSPYELFDELDSSSGPSHPEHSSSTDNGSGTGLPFEGYVIVDSQAPITANIAANYSSVENLLPVTEELLATDKLPNLQVRRDLRSRFRGMDKLEVYEWAFENQWPEANHARVANLGTPEPAPADQIPTNAFYTSNRARDYTVAERGFFFELASDGDEYDLKDRILQAMEPRGYVFGWHQGAGETAHISQLSKNGQLALGASTYAANFSFHSRVKIPGAVQRFRRKASRPRTAGPLEEKIYLTFVLSDGDSMNFLARRAQGGQWLLPERGEIPFGWEMQPLLADVAPGILDYFQATATENDYFVNGVSGIGYFYPEEMSDANLRDVLNEARPYLRRTGLTGLTVMSPTGPVTDETAQTYADILGDRLTGVMEGYVRRGADTERLYDGRRRRGRGRIPVRASDATAWLPTSNPEGSETVGNWVESLKRLAKTRLQRPLFVPLHVPAHQMTVADMVKVIEQIGPEFEVVAPDAFYALFARARPGTIVIEPPEGFAPERKILISGQANDIQAELQSFDDRTKSVDLRMEITSDALDRPITREKAVRIEAGEITQATFSVEIPEDIEGEEGLLEYSIDGGTPLVSAPVRFSATGVPDYTYEAEDGNHRAGRRVQDPQALNGEAWQAVADQDDGNIGSNHVVWYPTEDQNEPGDYVARFRMKVADNDVDERIARIDAVENLPAGAPGGPTAPEGPSRDLKATDFARAGEYEYFEVPFSLPIIDSEIPPAQMQYRVAYEGRATLTVDRIEVSKVG